MNCREAHTHLFAERDGALETTQRAALDQHVAQCAPCRRMREDLTAALTAWRDENARTPLPDVEREWHAVRRQIRGGVGATATGTSSRPRRLFAWLAVPLGAAAAVALAFFIKPATAPRPAGPATAPTAQIARADSVEVAGNASTLVYVDDKSGWLIVWASDANQI